jgi:hypothetical protein
MRTKLVLPLVVLCICVIPSSDYAFGQKLYPVQGPIASQAAPPVFSGQIRRPMFGGSLPTLPKSWTVAIWRSTAGEVRSCESDVREHKDAGNTGQLPAAA